MVVSIAQAQMFFLAFVRIMALIIPIPMLGGQNIPTQVRVGVGFILTIVMLPWQPLPVEAASMPTFEMALSIIREMIIGVLMGFAAQMTFGAIQVAANFMGLNTGFAAGQVLNPTFGGSGAAYDSLYLVMSTFIFMIMDGHLLFIRGIRLSFDVIPLNGPLPPLSPEPLLTLSAQLLLVGVQLALPIIAIVMFTDITAGLLARVAPQIQVFYLAIDIKLLISLIGIAIAFTMTLPWLRELFLQMVPRGLKLIGGY